MSLDTPYNPSVCVVSSSCVVCAGMRSWDWAWQMGCTCGARAALTLVSSAAP